MADASNRRSFGAAVSVRQHAVRAAPSSVICAPSARDVAARSLTCRIEGGYLYMFMRS